jgi:hypothetical protein
LSKPVSDTIDLKSLATTQTDSQGHLSDNALQSDWTSFLTGNTSDVINSLTTAGYGTGGLTAEVTQTGLNSFLYKIGTSVVAGTKNATNSAPLVSTINPPNAVAANTITYFSTDSGSNSGGAAAGAGVGGAGEGNSAGDASGDGG